MDVRLSCGGWEELTFELLLCKRHLSLALYSRANEDLGGQRNVWEALTSEEVFEGNSQ